MPSYADAAYGGASAGSSIDRVVILSDSAYVDGGGASVALKSALALARSGLRVTVITAVGPPMQALLEEPNIEVLCSDQKNLATSPLSAAKQSVWNDRSARTLADVLSGCDPRTTIVHVHVWTKALSSSIFHTASRLKFKTVVTLHDFFSVCPNGSFYLHRDQQICTLKPMGPRCIATDCDSRNYAVKAYRVVRQAVQQRIGGMPGAIKNFISVSAFSQAILQPNLPADSSIYPVRNPVDRSEEPPATPELHERFLYVGRFSPEKGIALLAKAASDAGVRVDFAGEGPCSKDVAEFNPDAQTLGWLSAAEVETQMRNSRALVLPSLWYETYGLTVMEAAAVGVPAIVADTSAARHLVVNDETGLWFEGGNAASLAEKLRRLAEPGVAERMGAAAYRRYWADPPTMAKHVEALLDVYARVLASAD